MRDKGGEADRFSTIYRVIHEGLLIHQAALRQRLVSRRYPISFSKKMITFKGNDNVSIVTPFASELQS